MHCSINSEAKWGVVVGLLVVAGQVVPSVERVERVVPSVERVEQVALSVGEQWPERLARVGLQELAPW